MELTELMEKAESEAERERLLTAYSIGLNDGAKRCINLILESVFDDQVDTNDIMTKVKETK